MLFQRLISVLNWCFSVIKIGDMPTTKTTPEARRNTPEITLVDITEQTVIDAMEAFCIARITRILHEEQHGQEGKTTRQTKGEAVSVLPQPGGDKGTVSAVLSGRTTKSRVR